MYDIRSVHARQILDSRGNPTVEADVRLANGAFGRASVPSGASTGEHEAVELRDHDKHRYGGEGVLKAVADVNGPIAAALLGHDALDQAGVDARMLQLDGTANESRLGANAILAVSLATAKAAASAQLLPLYRYLQSLSPYKAELTMPVPMINIINGGVHTRWQSTDIQEFMIMPAGAANFSEAVRIGDEIFHELGRVLIEAGYGTTVGDEGGYAPHVHAGNEEALALIVKATHRAGYHLGSDIVLAIDAAASELYHDDEYVLQTDGRQLDTEAMISWLTALARKYHIASIEDGLDQDDWKGWGKLNGQLGKAIQIVGDDLFVTNTRFLARGIREKSANAILIKLNQIGTLTATIEAVAMAHQAGWHAIISHRSGETEDTTIAHLVVGLGTGQIKTGSLSRGERVAKYNELLRISEELGAAAPYAGRQALTSYAK